MSRILPSLLAAALLVVAVMLVHMPASGAPPALTIDTFAGGGTGGQLSDRIEAFDVDASGAAYVLTPTCDIFRIENSIPTRVAGVGLCIISEEGAVAAETPIRALDMSVTSAGQVYFVERHDLVCTLRTIVNGIIVNAGGNGSCSQPADGANVVAGGLDYVHAVAVSDTGHVYIASVTSCRVWKISSGVITKVGGMGACGYTLGPDAKTTYVSPDEIGVDPSGASVYIAERYGLYCHVRKISAGVISNVAGHVTGAANCTTSGDGGPATSAEIDPVDVDASANGDVYVGGYCHARKVTGGTISTVATCNSSLPGVPYMSGLQPERVALRGTSELWMGEDSLCRVTRVNSGVIETMAGGACSTYAGDGGPASDAKLFNPLGVATDEAGNFYISDFGNCRIRRVDAAGIITTIAGGGDCHTFVEPPPPGVPVPALGSPIRAGSITVDGDGNPIVVVGCVARRIEGGMITTIIGNNDCTSMGTMTDGAPATSGSIQVRQVAASGDDLYVTDYCKVWRVTAGIAHHVAGGPFCNGSSDEGVPATSAQLDDPRAIAVDGAGTVYVGVRGSPNDCRVRKIAQGIITTVAGTVCGYTGDGGPATAATITEVASLAVDTYGSVYIADKDNCRIRKIMDGVINTIVGNGVCGFSPDGSEALLAQIDTRASLGVNGIAVDTAHNLYVPNQFDRVRIIEGTLDTDGDGCTDAHEMGDQEQLGGDRDPWNQWDFYDVNATRRVDAADIGLVRSKFNQSFPAYDRSAGAAPWAPGPPNGIVDAVDIALVRNSFNHNCQAPP